VAVYSVCGKEARNVYGNIFLGKNHLNDWSHIGDNRPGDDIFSQNTISSAFREAAR